MGTISERHAWIVANLLKVMVRNGHEVKQETCFFDLGVSKVRASVRPKGKLLCYARRVAIVGIGLTNRFRSLGVP